MWTSNLIQQMDPDRVDHSSDRQTTDRQTFMNNTLHELLMLYITLIIEPTKCFFNNCLWCSDTSTKSLRRFSFSTLVFSIIAALDFYRDYEGNIAKNDTSFKTMNVEHHKSVFSVLQYHWMISVPHKFLLV